MARGFVTGSVVNWNGGARATTFVSTSQLTAAILASDIASASTASVTVVSPNPGGGPSNVVYFSITNPTNLLFVKSDLFSGPAPGSVTTGDFNLDGKVDIAVANEGDATIAIFLGNGDGTFQAPLYSATAAQPFFVQPGDFNGDVKLDFAATSFFTNTVSILLGNGDGTFQPHVDYPVGSGPELDIAGDFNRDGKLDLAVTNLNDNSVSILLGN